MYNPIHDLYHSCEVAKVNLSSPAAHHQVARIYVSLIHTTPELFNEYVAEALEELNDDFCDAVRRVALNLGDTNRASFSMMFRVAATVDHAIDKYVSQNLEATVNELKRYQDELYADMEMDSRIDEEYQNLYSQRIV